MGGVEVTKSVLQAQGQSESLRLHELPQGSHLGSQAATAPPKQQESPMPLPWPHLTATGLFSRHNLRLGTKSPQDTGVGAGTQVSLDPTSLKSFSHDSLKTLIVTAGYR